MASVCILFFVIIAIGASIAGGVFLTYYIYKKVVKEPERMSEAPEHQRKRMGWADSGDLYKKSKTDARKRQGDEPDKWQY